MVLGLFKSAFDVDDAVNNLIEAEFEPSTLSLVGKNHHEIQEIGDTKGSLMQTPLKDLQKILIARGAKEADAKSISDEVHNGQILLSIEAENAAEDVAAEMLKDAGALQVTVFVDTLVQQ